MADCILSCAPVYAIQKGQVQTSTQSVVPELRILSTTWERQVGFRLRFWGACVFSG